MLMKIETELLRQLETEICDLTRGYIELRNRHLGKRGGSRTFMMLDRFGPMETAARLIMRSSNDGLKFLHSIGRLELAIETVVLKEQYTPLFSAKQHVLMRARANLKATTDPDQPVPEF